MMIGALTGARLDAIVGMKLKDTVDGAFTFKPQKREPTSRDVPIHPALREIAERRVEGKEPDDEFFPCEIAHNSDPLRGGFRARS